MMPRFENGYTVVDDGIGPTHLAYLVNSLRVALSSTVPVSGPNANVYDEIMACELVSHQALYDACLTVGSSFSAYYLLGQSRIMHAAADFFETAMESLHFMPLHVAIQLPGDTRFDYDWHQESQFYPRIDDVLNVWFPICAPTTDSTGTLVVVPSSHHQGALPTRETIDANGYRQITPCTAIRIDEHVPIYCSPCDFVMFDANMIHRSAPNVSTVPRVTGIVRVVNQAKQKVARPLYKAFSYEG